MVDRRSGRGDRSSGHPLTLSQTFIVHSKRKVSAKTLLLYRVDGEDFVLCWKTMAVVTGTERNKETNISARWKMQFSNNGSAELVSVPTNTITRCLHVFEHQKTKELPIPSSPVPPAERVEYAIDESYDRYAWALNFLDPSRWSQ